MLGRPHHPMNGLLWVRRNATTFEKEIAEVKLSGRVVLECGALIPLESLAIVVRNARAHQIEQAELVLANSLQVVADDRSRVAQTEQAPSADPGRLVAALPDRGQVMRDDDQRPATPLLWRFRFFQGAAYG